MNNNVFQLSSNAARTSDLLSWRRMFNDSKKLMSLDLASLRSGIESAPPRQVGELPKTVLSVKSAYVDYFAVVLGAIESGNSVVVAPDQFIADVVAPDGWSHTGLAVIADIPEVYGYFLASFIGAKFAQLGRFESIARLLYDPLPIGTQMLPLIRRPALVGWPESLGGNSLVGFRTLFQLAEEWLWLQLSFGAMEDLKVSMCSYFMVANLCEFAESVQKPEALGVPLGSLSFDTPVHLGRFASEVQRRSVSRLVAARDKLSPLLRQKSNGCEDLAKHWNYWCSHMQFWANRDSIGSRISVDLGELRAVLADA